MQGMRTVTRITGAVLIVVVALFTAGSRAAGETEIPQAARIAEAAQLEKPEQNSGKTEALTTPAQTEQPRQQYTPSTEAAAGYISEAELMAICNEAGAIYNICPELLQALVERESSGYIQAHNAGCCGLAQVSTRWHADRMERLGVTDIYEPYGNILVAADYLRELFDEDEGNDVYYVLMRYNMAIDTANELYEAGEITDYAVDITERAAELERLHGK